VVDGMAGIIVEQDEVLGYPDIRPAGYNSLKESSIRKSRPTAKRHLHAKAMDVRRKIFSTSTLKFRNQY